jgi:hypothetical protein
MAAYQRLGEPSAHSFWNSPRFSDYKLAYGHKVIYAHKFVLCARSAFFHSMLEGDWKVSMPQTSMDDNYCYDYGAADKNVSDGQETIEGIFHFPAEDDPEVVERMLQHIYECLSAPMGDEDDGDGDGDGDDDDEEQEAEDEGSAIPSRRTMRFSGGMTYRDELLARIHEYAMADRYGVPSLKRAAWAWCVDTTDLLAHEVARGRIVEPLELVYTTTPSDDRLLRDLLLNVVAGYLKKLLRRADFRDLLIEIPEIGVDLLKHEFS